MMVLLDRYNLAKDLKKINFEKIFIFNSSVRFNINCKDCWQIKEYLSIPTYLKKKINM